MSCLRSPASSHTRVTGSSSSPRASALASTIPLMPPADVPATTSITTRVRTPSRCSRAFSRSQYTRSLAPSANGFSPWSAVYASDATTSLCSSFVTPCIQIASDTPP